MYFMYTRVYNILGVGSLDKYNTNWLLYRNRSLYQQQTYNITWTLVVVHRRPLSEVYVKNIFALIFLYGKNNEPFIIFFKIEIF
jgi:hypothetical protein